MAQPSEDVWMLAKSDVGCVLRLERFPAPPRQICNVHTMADAERAAATNSGGRKVTLLPHPWIERLQRLWRGAAQPSGWRQDDATR